MLIDLRDSIEDHCETCPKLASTYCQWCFFASIDLGRKDLGNKRTYARAYHYLKCLHKSGFMWLETFGGRLNIKRKVC